jgi:hypothetical protein
VIASGRSVFPYLETLERPREIFPGLVEARFAKGRRKTPGVPLGRMVLDG